MAAVAFVMPTAVNVHCRIALGVLNATLLAECRISRPIICCRIATKFCSNGMIPTSDNVQNTTQSITCGRIVAEFSLEARASNAEPSRSSNGCETCKSRMQPAERLRHEVSCGFDVDRDSLPTFDCGLSSFAWKQNWLLSSNPASLNDPALVEFSICWRPLSNTGIHNTPKTCRNNVSDYCSAAH